MTIKTIGRQHARVHSGISSTFIATRLKMKSFFPFAIMILSAMTATSQRPEISLNHIALYVEDLGKSTRFYKDVLGLDTVPEPFKDGLHAWFKIGNGLTLHIIQGPKEKLMQYRNTHTCFSVRDIDHFIQHLTKAGINYEDVKGKQQAVTTRVDGVKQIYFKDPDGYWIEINNDK
jgi:lactoylglutathione lyase